MRGRTSYRLIQRTRAFETGLDALLGGTGRTDRIVESLRSEIVSGGGQGLRIRKVFADPREIYRIEFEVPEMSYQRTTLLDREALEDLLEIDEVRDLVLAGRAG